MPAAMPARTLNKNVRYRMFKNNMRSNYYCNIHELALQKFVQELQKNDYNMLSSCSIK